MKKLQLSSIRLSVIGCLMLLTSCSSANVSGEWDCPKQKGIGCITIKQADSIALQKLSDENYEPEVKSKFRIQPKKELHEIWLAPYIDSSGYTHDASVIKYESAS